MLEKPESIAYDKPRKLPDPNTITGATYCFIVTGSSANILDVTVDLQFFTANTNTVNCFTLPPNECGITHNFQLSEFLLTGTECTYQEKV